MIKIWVIIVLKSVCLSHIISSESEAEDSLEDSSWKEKCSAMKLIIALLLPYDWELPLPLTLKKVSLLPSCSFNHATNAVHLSLRVPALLLYSYFMYVLTFTSYQQWPVYLCKVYSQHICVRHKTTSCSFHWHNSLQLRRYITEHGVQNATW